MKKILLILLMALMLTGCNPANQSDTEVVPVPVPIQLGMVECPECCGDGLIDIEKESVHCPRCDGFGKLHEVEMGILKNYSSDFAKGYKAFEAGDSIKKSPLLRFRAREWKAGWLEAKKQSEK